MINNASGCCLWGNRCQFTFEDEKPPYMRGRVEGSLQIIDMFSNNIVSFDKRGATVVLVPFISDENGDLYHQL